MSKNSNAWSFSKSQVWNTCKKMYYFSYIKRFDSDELGKIVSELYNLSSIQMHKGELVHRAIENYIQNVLCGAKYNLNHAAKVAATKIDHMCAEKKTTEQTNGLTLSEDFINKIKNEILKCLHTFESVWPTISNYQSILIEKYGSFKYGDVEITVKPDYVVKDEEKVIIFDWKTGSKKDDDFYQSIVYSIYAMDRFNLSEKDISVVLVYLSDCKKYKVTPEHRYIENIEKRIVRENDEMNMLDYIPEVNLMEYCIFCKYYTICELQIYNKNAEKIIV